MTTVTVKTYCFYNDSQEAKRSVQHLWLIFLDRLRESELNSELQKSYSPFTKGFTTHIPQIEAPSTAHLIHACIAYCLPMTFF